MSDNMILWGIVSVYLAFIFFKGVSKVFVIKDADDFLVAGRNTSWFLLFCTMGATVIGGGASIGAIGKTYDWGILMVLVSTGWYIHFIFSGLFVAPKFRDAELYTVAGFFKHRFGERARFMALVLSLLFSVFIVAAQMAAFGSVLKAIMPEFTDHMTVLRLAILIGGFLVIVYSTAGGLMAVIHTDVYQFIILILGFLFTVGMVAPDIISNWGHIQETVKPEFFMLDGGKGWVFLVTTFLAFLLGETFAPGYATRYCVGKDIASTKKGIAGVGLFLALVFPIVLFVIALYARIHFPDISPQEALPKVVWNLHNPIIGAIIIAALLSAVMSSADSALNSATAIFVKDLFEDQLGMADPGDGTILKRSRFFSAGLGVVSMLIALWNPDIIGLLLFTYHLWAPAIIVPVIVGVFSRARSHNQNTAVFYSMVGATTLTMTYLFGVYNQDTLKERFSEWAGFGLPDPAVVGVLFSLFLFCFLRYIVFPGNGAPIDAGKVDA